MYDKLEKILEEVKRRRDRRSSWINDLMDQISLEEIYEDDIVMADIARKNIKKLVKEIDFIHRRRENPYFSLNEKSLPCVGVSEANDQTGQTSLG